MEQTAEKEKILFQYIMNYKAYRRRAISLRIAVAVVIAGGLLGLCAVSLVAGITASIAALFAGALAVLVSLGYEESYTVYNTRIVIKKRNKDKRLFIPIGRIKSVSYKRAFYEKGLATGTVRFAATDDKGKLKKYKLKNIFDAQPAVEYLKNVILNNNAGENHEGRK